MIGLPVAHTLHSTLPTGTKIVTETYMYIAISKTTNIITTVTVTCYTFHTDTFHTVLTQHNKDKTARRDTTPRQTKADDDTPAGHY